MTVIDLTIMLFLLGSSPSLYWFGYTMYPSCSLYIAISLWLYRLRLHPSSLIFTYSQGIDKTEQEKP